MRDARAMHLQESMEADLLDRESDDEAISEYAGLGEIRTRRANSHANYRYSAKFNEILILSINHVIVYSFICPYPYRK